MPRSPSRVWPDGSWRTSAERPRGAAVWSSPATEIPEATAAGPNLPAVSTGRIEAFSDGVIAVAITLLVLDLHVPPPRAGHSLAHELLAQWPSYAAYLISFVTIGIIWINHHSQLARLARADHGVLIRNLALLMTISVIPFATSLMANYLKQGQGENLAAAVYGAALLAMALAFSALNHHILIRRPQLIGEPLPEAERRLIFRRALSGVIPYLLATGLAFVSPYITLAASGALALFYATPFAVARERASTS